MTPNRGTDSTWTEVAEFSQYRKSLKESSAGIYTAAIFAIGGQATPPVTTKTVNITGWIILD